MRGLGAMMGVRATRSLRDARANEGHEGTAEPVTDMRAMTGLKEVSGLRLIGSCSFVVVLCFGCAYCT